MASKDIFLTQRIREKHEIRHTIFPKCDTERIKDDALMSRLI